MAIETNTTIVSECPRFSAEIFIFLPSSWYGVMFWDVNNADKTLLFFFLLLLAQNQRLFTFLYLPGSEKAGGAQENWRGRNQDR